MWLYTRWENHWKIYHEELNMVRGQPVAWKSRHWWDSSKNSLTTRNQDRCGWWCISTHWNWHWNQWVRFYDFENLPGVVRENYWSFKPLNEKKVSQSDFSANPAGGILITRRQIAALMEGSHFDCLLRDIFCKSWTRLATKIKLLQSQSCSY